jgi:hypothetical protein
VLIKSLPKGDHTIHFGRSFQFVAGDFGTGSDPLTLPLDMTYGVTQKQT